uniref:Uncharacterized protein n=1 Tax=Parastrongyloides trichosuri TaxID=131310 RepID=A0A0N5A3W7_PARTI
MSSSKSSTTSTSFFDFASSTSSEDETVTSLKVNISREASIEENCMKEEDDYIKNVSLNDNNSTNGISKIEIKKSTTTINSSSNHTLNQSCIELMYNNQLSNSFTQLPITLEEKSKSINVLSILSSPNDLELNYQHPEAVKVNKKNLSFSYLPQTSFMDDKICKRIENRNSKRLHIYNCYEIASAMNLNDYNKKEENHIVKGNKIMAEEIRECRRNNNIYSKLDNIISGFNVNKMLTQSLFLPTSKDGFSLNDLSGMF